MPRELEAVVVLSLIDEKGLPGEAALLF